MSEPVGDHECSCVRCDPSLATPADVPEDRYFAPGSVILVDGERNSVRDFRWFLDGVEIGNDAAEVVVGEDGWATLYRRDGDDRRHLCRRCRQRLGLDWDGICRERRHGHVTYELRDSSSKAAS